MSSKEPTFWNALVCVAGVLLIVVAGVLFSDIEVHILLLGALLWAGMNTTWLGYPFKEINAPQALMKIHLEHLINTDII